MEVLYKSSQVRCHGLLCIQRHVFIRLWDDWGLKTTCTIHDILDYTNNLQFSTYNKHKCQDFLVQDVFRLSGETVSCHFHTILIAFASFAQKMINPLCLTRFLRDIEEQSIIHYSQILSMLSMGLTSWRLSQRRRQFRKIDLDETLSEDVPDLESSFSHFEKDGPVEIIGSSPHCSYCSYIT